MRSFFAPSETACCTALRSSRSPEPIVILPSRSRIVTPSLCLADTFIRSLLTLDLLPLCRTRRRAAEALAQRHHGPAAGAEAVVDLVHEALHKEDAAAVRLQQVLGR